MKSLKLYGARDIRFGGAEKPQILDGKDVIVKIKACGICGCDISRYKKLGAVTPGQVWGHEFAGVVEQVGDQVTDLKVGDHVAGCPALIEEDDYYYRAGQPARANSLHAIGAKEPGGFAEYIKLPEKNLVKVPDDLDFESASMSRTFYCSFTWVLSNQSIGGRRCGHCWSRGNHWVVCCSMGKNIWREKSNCG